jgi:hypothetical protein
VSDTSLNTQAQTPTNVVVTHVHERKASIARLSLGYWTDRPGSETLVQLTNPIGQHIALYVHANEKARFIDEVRKMLAAWEKSP